MIASFFFFFFPETQGNDIVIRIRVNDELIDAKSGEKGVLTSELIDCLNDIDQALIESDLRDLNELIEYLKAEQYDLRNVNIEGYQDQIKKNNYSSYIFSAQNGSILINIIVGGLVYKVADNILSDLFKDVIKESELYVAIKDGLKALLDAKSKKTTASIREIFKKYDTKVTEAKIDNNQDDEISET